MPLPDLSQAHLVSRHRQGWRWAALGLVLLLQANAPVVRADASQPKSLTIIKSDNDDRQYRYLELPNHLKVLLISDANAEKSAAALDVNIGSGEDPPDRPGLAHFLEHMLFLGTQKYPKPEEYQAFIKEHGGDNNAYTALEHTNYHFDIEPAYLEPALDRFAQFFIAPTLDENFVDKERNAVNSEFAYRYKEEARRAGDVWPELASPANKSARFAVGTLDTLADKPGRKVRDELLRFYQGYYSANLMVLTVLGREPLDRLEAMVVPRFSLIANRNVALATSEVPFFADGVLPVRMNIRPVSDLRSLAITFPVAPFDHWYRERPLEYLGHLLGHEGKGSLFRLLHDKGWVTSLSAGGDTNRQSADFTISMLLTEEGGRHIYDIVDAVFQMLALVKQQGVEQWRYTELGTINSTNFRFQEKGEPENYVSTLASNMQSRPPQEVISSLWLMEKYDATLIQHYLDAMTPDHVVLAVMAPDMETKKVSRFYKTQYAVQAIPAEQLQRWRSSLQRKDVTKAEPLALPTPNEFVSKNLKLKYTDEPRQAAGTRVLPRVLRESVNQHVWFKQDELYHVPRGTVYLYARSDLTAADLEGQVMTAYLVRLLNDNLDVHAYPASLAGLDLSLHQRARGVELSIAGYSEKQGLLLSRTLDAIASPMFTEADFNHVKEELLRELDNEDKLSPNKQLAHRLLEILGLQNHPHTAFKTLASGVTLKQLQDFTQRWLRGLNVDMLVYGNFTESDALKLASMTGNKLGLNAPMRPVSEARLVKLPASAHGSLYTLPVDHADSAVMHYVQGNDASELEQARMMMLAQLMGSDFFDQLRTQQQLGYVVAAQYYPYNQVPGLVMLVESPSHSAEHVDDSINHFVAQFAKTLASMPPDVFEQHRSALLRNIEEKPHNLGEEAAEYWSQIGFHQFRFDAREKMLAAVKSLDQKSLADYYWKMFLSPNVHRLVEVAYPHNQKLPDKLTDHYGLIENLDTFKQQQETFALP